MFDELFQKKGLTLERLRRLVTASNYPSYADAAQGDPTVASQFSRDISALEAFFECKLVEKKGRQIAGLTEQGERLRHLVTEYFNALTALRDEFRDPPREITVGGGEAVLQWVICTRLVALKEAFPNSRLKLKNFGAAETIHRIEEGSLDVGIVDEDSLLRGGVVPDHFAVISLGEIGYALYLTEELFERHRGMAERELLESLPLAGLEGLAPLATPYQVEDAIPGYRLNLAVVLTSFPQVVQAVRGGALAGFLPTLADDDLRRHGIIRIDNEILRDLTVRISLIYNARLQGVKPYLATVGTKIHEILSSATDREGK